MNMTRSPWAWMAFPLALALCLTCAARGVAAELLHNVSCFLAAASQLESFWTLEDLDLLLDRGGGRQAAGQELGFRHIFFVVKASRARAANAILMERSWMHSSAGRVYLVDDVITGLPESLQVVINSGSDGDDRTTDAVAVSRVSIWLRQTMHDEGQLGLPPQTRWLVMLDDDTLVNLARLFHFLRRYDRLELPVLFAHVLSSTDVYDFNLPCMSSGAVLLNERAFRRMGEKMSCKECPHVGSDGIALGYCAAFHAVPVVHVPALHCHPPLQGEADAALLDAPLQQGWIAAGGLSLSTVAEEVDSLPGHTALLRNQPFDPDFPECPCALPLWPEHQALPAQVLFERTAACGAAATFSPPQLPVPLDDGDTLDAHTLGGYFDMPVPGKVSVFGNATSVTVRPLDRQSLLEAATERPGGWTVLSQDSRTWVNVAAIGPRVAEVEASGLFPHATGVGHGGLAGGLLFAFVVQELSVVDPGAGLVLNGAAALALARSWDLSTALNASFVASIGVTLAHQPLMVPEASMLPKDLRGMVSAAAAAAAWTVGSVVSPNMRDDLEAKAESRRFLSRLLWENFGDIMHAQQQTGSASSGPCGADEQGAVTEARSWLSYLHDTNDHIKAVRGFKGGRREFRAHHAMYRSEASDGLPGELSPDTVVVARNCT